MVSEPSFLAVSLVMDSAVSKNTRVDSRLRMIPVIFYGERMDYVPQAIDFLVSAQAQVHRHKDAGPEGMGQWPKAGPLSGREREPLW